jgi:HSP20 family protein
MRFGSFRRDLDRLFEQIQCGSRERWPLGERSFPALNVWDEGESIRAEAEVPGFEMKDLEVTVLGNELTIKGRREASKQERATLHRHERFTGEFVRSLTLPVEVDPDQVDATLKDGVLTLVLPKTQAALARKITVKAG